VAASYYEYRWIDQWRLGVILVSGSISGGFLLEVTLSVATSYMAHDSTSGGYILSIAAVQSVAVLYLYLPFALIYLQEGFASWHLIPFSATEAH
jgi:uncharacterized protein (DUF486 family)